MVLKMNERIKKLAEQSGFYFYDLHDIDGQDLGETIESDDWESMERFAELIIQDVINSIESTGFNHVQKHGLRTTILSNLGYKYPYSEFE